MKKILFIVAFLLFNSCNSHNNKLQFLYNLPKDLTIDDYNTINVSDDFIYPKYYYVVINGEKNNLFKFIKNLGMVPYCEQNVIVNSKKILGQYNKDALWKLNSILIKKDTHLNIFINTYSEQNSFAGYFYNGNPILIFFDKPKNKFNGRIIGFIEESKCYILVEELYSPELNRNLYD